jgi:hypothetical protein
MVWDFIVGAFLLVMVVGSFVGLFLGWTSNLGIVNGLPVTAWRLAAARIGLFAVSAQALFFIALWTPFVHHRILLWQCVPLEFLLLFIAAPCILSGRMQHRWWLLTSSAFLPIVSFFVVLSEVAY